MSKPRNVVPPSDIRDFLTYDPETGIFLRKKLPGRGGLHRDPKVGSIESNGYHSITHMGVRYRSHRLAWWFVYGEMPPTNLDIDHVNGHRQDNRIANLRLATRSQNNVNGRPKRHGRKYCGVFFCKDTGRWRACLGLNYRRVDLGRHDTPEAAARAYDAAAIQHYGEYARLNFQE